MVDYDRLKQTGHVRNHGDGIAHAVIEHGLSIRLELLDVDLSDLREMVDRLVEAQMTFEPWVMWVYSPQRAINLVAYFSNERDMIAFKMLGPAQA